MLYNNAIAAALIVRLQPTTDRERWWISNVVVEYLRDQLLGMTAVLFQDTRGCTHVESFFLQELEHALGYVRSLPSGESVCSLDVTNAIRLGNNLITSEAAQFASTSEQTTDTTVVFAWPDGYTMRTLLTPNALHVEGCEMSHCVGSQYQPYLAKVAAGTIKIWSLRDETNWPHVTVEYEIATQLVHQIKAEYNRPVAVAKRHYIWEFLQHLVATQQLVRVVGDLHHVGLLELTHTTWTNL